MTTTEAVRQGEGHILEHNRFRWANRLGIPIPSYGAPPEAVYAIALPISDGIACQWDLCTSPC
ncbi:MAG: hypothetical protein F4202_07175 [Cenarchaeum sp. SB0677_bin_16]|nr:hypothetical protein [Cenarchaeum sp. SB0677_bin_16]